MTTILGVNAYHGDAAAALLIDGKLVAAVEEERFRRVKHWAGFPTMAIAYCLREGGITLDQVEHLAVNSNPRGNFRKKIAFTLSHRPDWQLLIDRIKNAQKRSSIATVLKEHFPHHLFQGQLHRVDHHEAHLASCFFVSPFAEATVVSVDGFGDFCSTAWGGGHGETIDIVNRVYFPHSLGIFYQALTQYLGFPHYGDEYKVMGLGPYGKPQYLNQLRRIVHLHDDGAFSLNLDYFLHHSGKFSMQWEEGIPQVGRLFSPALEELLGPARTKGEALADRHRDIARSTQAMYEEAFFHLLNSAHRHHPSDFLTLAGGCAMNSVANGKVYSQTPFKKLYVQSAAGDAGGAIGAAFHVWSGQCGRSDGGPVASARNGAGATADMAQERPTGNRHFTMDHAYWGPSFSDEEIGALLATRKEELVEKSCHSRYIHDSATLCKESAAAIANGLVVGWFQGRLEWGPRALGNRSIVCDPRRADMKDILNSKIKRRESFRPFAPSILREKVNEWFATEDDVPFMMQVFQILPHRRNEIPAVTHVDGSGRLQTVTTDSNPLYYQLIKAFAEITAIPIVLNTSFNENEPIVCHPGEALDCFLRTRMDVLVLGNYFIYR